MSVPLCPSLNPFGKSDGNLGLLHHIPQAFPHIFLLLVQSTLTPGDMGSIPDPGTKIPRAQIKIQQSQIKFNGNFVELL